MLGDGNVPSLERCLLSGLLIEGLHIMSEARDPPAAGPGWSRIAVATAVKITPSHRPISPCRHKHSCFNTCNDSRVVSVERC